MAGPKENFKSVSLIDEKLMTCFLWWFHQSLNRAIRGKVTTQPSLKAPNYGCFGRKLLKGLGDRGHFLILSVTLKRSVVKKKGGKRQIQNYKNIHVHVCNFSLLYIILRLKISKII